MTPLPLFLYGTLRDPDILAAVLGRIVPAGELVAATAPDCAAVYFPGQVYPALVGRVGAVAAGLLLTRLTPDDLRALDAFEGDQYRRGPIEVRMAVGPLGAEVYWPTIAVSAAAPDWTIERWTSQHKPAVLAQETELARAARLATVQHEPSRFRGR